MCFAKNGDFVPRMVRFGVLVKDGEGVEKEGKRSSPWTCGMRRLTLRHQLDLVRNSQPLDRRPEGIRERSVEHSRLHHQHVLLDVDRGEDLRLALSIGKKVRNLHLHKIMV